MMNQPAKQTRTRKYSDEMFDNPDYQAKIEQQTLAMIQGITGDASIDQAELFGAPKQQKASKPMTDEEKMMKELQSIIEMEMKNPDN